MNIRETLLVFVFTISAVTLRAQPETIQKARVGIFMPLYLDSVFNNSGSYKYNNTIPKYVMPGLEFYSGVQMAIDSLDKEGIGAEIFIIDSKDRSKPLSSHLTQELGNAALLIGMVANVGELKTLADAAKAHNIPFISATYPNDGGIAGNPSLIILNSTLKTHCQGIYKILSSTFRNDNIIILSKPGAQEDKIKSVLEESNRAARPALNWKMGDITAGVNPEMLGKLLDSTRNNVVVCGSFDETIATDLVKQLSSLRGTYRSSAIGMPTWSDINFNDADFKSVEILFSTPFLTSSGNSRVFNSLSNKFKARIHSRPSDMVFKGFEITYRYIKNMLAHQDNIVDLSDHAGKVFSDFDIQPVKAKTSRNEPDYYENKKVYFIRKMDGAVKGIL